MAAVSPSGAGTALPALPGRTCWACTGSPFGQAGRLCCVGGALRAARRTRCSPWVAAGTQQDGRVRRRGLRTGGDRHGAEAALAPARPHPGGPLLLGSGRQRPRLPCPTGPGPAAPRAGCAGDRLCSRWAASGTCHVELPGKACLHTVRCQSASFPRREGAAAVLKAPLASRLRQAWVQASLCSRQRRRSWQRARTARRTSRLQTSCWPRPPVRSGLTRPACNLCSLIGSTCSCRVLRTPR